MVERTGKVRSRFMKNNKIYMTRLGSDDIEVDMTDKPYVKSFFIILKKNSL